MPTIDPDKEFPLDHGLVYLNHAAVSPLPARSANRLIEFARQYTYCAAEDYKAWLKQEYHLRRMLAGLINADKAGDIALLKNTSEGLSVVAHGFPWKSGDNVIISDQEFPSNRIVWESLERYGVETREIDLYSANTPEDALIAAIDDNTRLLSISSVQYASGLRVDLEVLGACCKDAEIAFCVDAIQGLGVIPHDVQKMNIDFLVSDGHKWLLGPEGLALFYCSEIWRDKLQLFQYGWHMLENAGNYDVREWSPALSGERFECGSPNMLGIYALSGSIELILEYGIETIEQDVLDRARILFELIDDRPDLVCISERAEGRFAGIVTFRSQSSNSRDIYRHLLNNRVICANRGGGIRFSPHFYTPVEKLEQAITMVPA